MPRPPGPPSLEEAPRGRRLARIIAGGSSVAAVMALVLIHGDLGWPVGPGIRLLTALAAAGFVGELALRWWGQRWRRRFLREDIAEVVPAALLLPALVLVLLVAPAGLLTAVEGYLAAALLAQVVRLYQAAHSASLGPAHLLVLSWVGAILIGTGLLMLPRATESGAPASVSTALFTATSAVCVTGLIVEDTGSYWSPGGELVILVLIQVGGVGLMTFAAFFALVLRRGLALRERLVLRDILSEERGRIGGGRLVLTILMVTICFEAAGAVGLYGLWPSDWSVGRRVYYSVFHAISAFCNAGFCLFRDSFVSFADRWQTMLVVPGLIICGGLGFTVLVNLWQVIRGRVARRLRHGHALKPRFSLQSTLVLLTTVALLAGGTALILVFERGGVLPNQSPAGAVRRAFFQSVTARTAGFNTVRVADLSLPTLCVLLAWMFIGASSGSTGGGIKTSTVAVLFANLWATLRRRAHVEAWRRTIPEETVHRALAVVSMGLLTVSLLILLLAVTERERFAFEDLCFEAFSAFGTVGLSRGITAELSPAGRIVIVLGMFLGRIGPLTLALAMYGKKRPARYEYPEEAVMIG